MTRRRVDEIERAVAILAAGGVVALPTETVYGLAADATNEAAVRRVFEVKGRPSGHPLIVHVASADQLDAVTAEVPEVARRLAAAFWPGPLTLVLKRGAAITGAVTGGLDTVAVRVPDHPVFLAVLRRLGRPLAAPSANRFGSVSPTTAEHVRRDLGRHVDLVVDGGACRIGIESTVIDVTADRPVILRPGSTPLPALEAVLGHDVVAATGTGRSPGQHPVHYAPRARVVIVEPAAMAAEARRRLARGERVGALCLQPVAGLPEGVGELSLPADLAAAARELYSTLRAADDLGLATLLVTLPLPDRGLGDALADRLRRAAAPRAEPAAADGGGAAG